MDGWLDLIAQLDSCALCSPSPSLLPVQYIGNAIGIIMGSIVLCSFKKCTYKTAGFLYILGCILDTLNAIILITYFFEYASDRDSLDDDNMRTIVYAALLLIVPPVLGGICFFFGAMYAFRASRNWEQSGAPGTLPV
ncbi:unnamed protein product [Scytosiphon promiscuus]